MKNILTAALVAVSVLAFSQESPNASMKQKPQSAKLNVKVVNEEDPICGMKTAQFLKDTLTYKKNVYGFCNTRCKETFKKSPKKYLKKK